MWVECRSACKQCQTARFPTGVPLRTQQSELGARRQCEQPPVDERDWWAAAKLQLADPAQAWQLSWSSLPYTRSQVVRFQTGARVSILHTLAQTGCTPQTRTHMPRSTRVVSRQTRGQPLRLSRRTRPHRRLPAARHRHPSQSRNPRSQDRTGHRAQTRSHIRGCKATLALAAVQCPSHSPPRTPAPAVQYPAPTPSGSRLRLGRTERTGQTRSCTPPST